MKIYNVQIYDDHVKVAMLEDNMTGRSEKYSFPSWFTIRTVDQLVQSAVTCCKLRGFKISIIEMRTKH
jgi:hypothetical protein